jgi:hypothetical protein
MKKLIGYGIFVIVYIILRFTIFSSTIGGQGSEQDFKDITITSIILAGMITLLFLYFRNKIREKKLLKITHQAYLQREAEAKESRAGYNARALMPGFESIIARDLMKEPGYQKLSKGDKELIKRASEEPVDGDAAILPDDKRYLVNDIEGFLKYLKEKRGEIPTQ